jgi:hypothetical protein
MKTKFKKIITTSLAFSLVGLFSIQAIAQSGEISRTPSGKPDLSGIWQAMTTAHYNVEPHSASYGPYPREMGAISAVPASLGLVEGGKIPYNEQALRVRDTNRATCRVCHELTTCHSLFRLCNLQK